MPRVAPIAAMTAAALLLPVAPASASCIAPSPTAWPGAGAKRIVIARALPGPSSGGFLLSPATFAVRATEKGPRVARITVRTQSTDAGNGSVGMTSVGIAPRAGELWRLFTRTGSGLFSPGCDASARVSKVGGAVRLRVDGRSVLAAPATWNGRPRTSVAPPTVRLRGARLMLRAPSRLTAVALLRGDRVVRADARPARSYRLKVEGARRGDRLVVDTGGGFASLRVG